MKAQREDRRRRAEEAKQQRLVEAKEAEGRGGIEVQPDPALCRACLRLARRCKALGARATAHGCPESRAGAHLHETHAQSDRFLMCLPRHFRPCPATQAVDFLRKIREYKEAHGVAAPAPWAAGGGGDLWESLDDSSIRVCVRKRPMLRTEIIRHDFDVISTEAGHQSLVVHEPKTKVDMSKEIASHR